MADSRSGAENTPDGPPCASPCDRNQGGLKTNEMCQKDIRTNFKELPMTKVR